MHQQPVLRRRRRILRRAQAVQCVHDQRRVPRHPLALAPEVEVVVGAAAEAKQRRVRRDEVPFIVSSIAPAHPFAPPRSSRATSMRRRRYSAMAPAIPYTSAPRASVASSPIGSPTRCGLGAFFAARRRAAPQRCPEK